MTLIEGFVRDALFIDFGADVLYGDDQAYIDYPCRFPTVGFQLMATNGLVQIADRIRKDKGFKRVTRRRLRPFSITQTRS